MTDWWSTAAPDVAGEKPESPPFEPEPSWTPTPSQNAPEESSAETEERPADKAPDRRKGILLGAAGAAVAGMLVFAVTPHGGTAPSGSPEPSVTASQGGFLPAAGGGAMDAPEEPQSASASVEPKVVTMTAEPSGTGRVGAIVKVTIHNGTDTAITVMSSMMKGDDRSAVLGEGTLAPGARRVEPGETVTGTVEFAVKQAPSQVVLFDIGGNVVAASR